MSIRLLQGCLFISLIIMLASAGQATVQQLPFFPPNEVVSLMFYVSALSAISLMTTLFAGDLAQFFEGASSYFLILIGAPLGYIASYFFQPGVMRMFGSLGDYVNGAPDILLRMSEACPESVSQTAWIGILLGVVLMAILAFITSSSRSTPSSKQ